jgi:Ca2+-binding RTX toxin-like protein
MNYNGTAGDDTLTGTSGNDVFNMWQGGNDTVSGGDGNDIFRFKGTFASGDQVDGGNGVDQLQLDGDYSAEQNINATQLSNVEIITVAAGHSYDLIFFDGVIADGSSLTIKGGTLGASDILTVDGGYLSAPSINTSLIVYGGAGDTFFTGGPGKNSFYGGAGDDTVYFGDNFGSNDRLDGGGGTNSLQLLGDYSAGLTLTATMFKNFGYLSAEAGYSYKLTMNDANVAAGQTLTVQAGGLSAANFLVFNGSHETDGSYYIYDGAGNDVLIGGAQADHLSGFNGGNDKLYGNGGDDRFQMGGALTSADHIDGGSGNDEVDLGGDYSAGMTFKAATMINVETIFLNSGYSYKLVMNDGNVAAGKSLSIIGGLLSSSDTLIVNASAETDGHYVLGGGSGDDVLIGGQAGNTFEGDYGLDKMTAGNGNDTFVYAYATDSTGVTRDIITGFNGLHDKIDLPLGYSVSAIDTAVTTGALSTATFDTNLEAAIDAAHLAAGDAVLFTPDAGTLHGHTFLIVDMNGIAGYQSGQDLVIQLESATHLASLGSGTFI